MNPFPCTKCGLCCRMVGIVEKAGLVSGLDRGDGICRNLDETTNLCRIYETRPAICSVDKTAEMFGYLDKREWYNINIRGCRQAQEKAGIPEKERIQYVR